MTQFGCEGQVLLQGLAWAAHNQLKLQQQIPILPVGYLFKNIFIQPLEDKYNVFIQLYMTTYN